MNVTTIEKALPKRETFICDICGYEREVGAFNPLYIKKTAGDFVVNAVVCRAHFAMEKGEIVYTPALLKLKFEVENKAKEILHSLTESEKK